MTENAVRLLAALLVAGSSAISGYRVHLWLIMRAPRLAAWIPRGGGVWAGLVVGLIAASRILP